MFTKHSDDDMPNVIVQKVPFSSPIWRSLKISPPTVEKPTSGTELYHRANFHADRREVNVSGQKYTFFIGDFPWGLPSHAVNRLRNNLCVEWDVKPYYTIYMLYIVRKLSWS